MADIKLPALPQPTPIKTAFGGTVLAYGTDQLRARDIEVAECVLKAAAKLVVNVGELLQGNATPTPNETAAIIRALEVSHD